jgi:hypothetical protein
MMTSNYYTIQGHPPVHPPYNDDYSDASTSSQYQEENALMSNSSSSYSSSTSPSSFDSAYSANNNNKINIHSTLFHSSQKIKKLRQRRLLNKNNHYPCRIDPKSHWNHDNGILPMVDASVIPHAIYIPTINYVEEDVVKSAGLPTSEISFTEKNEGNRDAAPETIVSTDNNDDVNYNYDIQSRKNASNIDRCSNYKNSNCPFGTDLHCPSCDSTLLEELSKSMFVHSMTYDKNWGMTTAMLLE